MTMPSIADVKAAADVCADAGGIELFEIGGAGRDSDAFIKSAATLAQFAMSVLNAPGLSAKRLAEIQRCRSLLAVRYFGDEHESYIVAKIGESTFSTDDDLPVDAAQTLESLLVSHDELLAEVLRMRAGVAQPYGPRRQIHDVVVMPMD